ncbi:hypothetical protein LAY57_24340 [Argonema antarcticum A004/B2]|nr:hypothetical protein [Argonema antarcticum A004/B2]
MTTDNLSHHAYATDATGHDMTSLRARQRFKSLAGSKRHHRQSQQHHAIRESATICGDATEYRQCEKNNVNGQSKRLQNS